MAAEQQQQEEEEEAVAAGQQQQQEALAARRQQQQQEEAVELRDEVSTLRVSGKKGQQEEQQQLLKKKVKKQRRLWRAVVAPSRETGVGRLVSALWGFQRQKRQQLPVPSRLSRREKKRSFERLLQSVCCSFQNEELKLPLCRQKRKKGQLQRENSSSRTPARA